MESQMRDLLKQKVKLLEAELEYRERLVEELRFQIKNGHRKPMGECTHPIVGLEMSEDRLREVTVIDIQIENVELKERWDALRCCKLCKVYYDDSNSKHLFWCDNCCKEAVRVGVRDDPDEDL